MDLAYEIAVWYTSNIAANSPFMICGIHRGEDQRCPRWRINAQVEGRWNRYWVTRKPLQGSSLHCCFGSIQRPPRTLSWQDSRALNPDSTDSIVDDNKHIVYTNSDSSCSITITHIVELMDFRHEYFRGNGPNTFSNDSFYLFKSARNLLL